VGPEYIIFLGNWCVGALLAFGKTVLEGWDEPWYREEDIKRMPVLHLV
jgi:hypothetical protein